MVCGTFRFFFFFFFNDTATTEIYTLSYTTLFRSCQEATVRTGHGTTDWFQIGKGVRQGCIFSPCLFNLYAEYIMRNAGLEEAQAGIKIAGKNLNNLRYADDTTLMEESEEELKSLLMKVKVESEKVPPIPVSATLTCSLAAPEMRYVKKALGSAMGSSRARITVGSRSTTLGCTGSAVAKSCQTLGTLWTPCQASLIMDSPDK